MLSEKNHKAESFRVTGIEGKTKVNMDLRYSEMYISYLFLQKSVCINVNIT